MHYPKSKVYFDGSHYIAIPHTEQPWKRRKRNICRDKNEEKVKEILESKKDKVKCEKIKETVEEIDKEVKDIEKSKEIVRKVLDKEKRNRIVRLTRLYRKVNLQQWTHFCTFTYDSEKLNEEEFKKKLLNCLRHLSSRKDWKYIGVWERSPINQRLHFHGIFVIPKMIGEIIETKDYSTKTHKIQITYQNTFFLDRFGRNDFKEIEHSSLVYQAISYILKYIRKTSEKVIYSKHLQTYFISDILENDIVCTIGQEDRKLLLFDVKVKTAVIYARYSSNNQTEQSIEGQVHVCQDFAKRNDIVIVDSYIDRAISGTTDEREAFQRMLKDSNNKKWDYVLVYKLDRFARNKYESAIHRKHLKDNGVKLLSAMENIPETPEGVLLESLLEGMNQYFSEELAQKVSRGLHESRMKGHCIGSVPFGYVKENKMLKINEDEASIVKRIFEDYASGKTILQICRDFEKENITNKGKKFIPDTIRHYLKNEFYTGVYRLNGKVYDKIYPPIISQELFQNVKKRLDANRYGCRKDNHEIFRLKDKIYCGCCDRKMYPVSAISSNGQTIRYYKCITTKKRNCPVGNMNKTFIENVIDKFLISQFNIPENLEEISNKIYELHKKRVGSNNSLNTLKSELQRTNTAISNIMIAIEKGILTDTTKSRLEELEKQKKDLQEKLVVEQSKEHYELTKEDIQNFFKYTMKKCPNKAIELFIKQVRVYDNKIEIYLNYSINQPQTTDHTSKKLFTETHTTQRIFKGGTIRTFTKTYDVYVVL